MITNIENYEKKLIFCVGLKGRVCRTRLTGLVTMVISVSTHLLVELCVPVQFIGLFSPRLPPFVLVLH